ncbi:unnamed protein product [Polarella glacialis]|uniref:Uncharacterized protein n=1 Tax=Polarella glacialis TaxID=89957 RepID=A0A813I5C1_POLGL|nr:unnamed protein product [Polarella glacialis]
MFYSTGSLLFFFLCGCSVSFVGGLWCGRWSCVCLFPFGCAGSFLVVVGGSFGVFGCGVSLFGSVWFFSLVLPFLFSLFFSFFFSPLVVGLVCLSFFLVSVFFPFIDVFFFFSFASAPLSSPPLF